MYYQTKQGKFLPVLKAPLILNTTISSDSANTLAPTPGPGLSEIEGYCNIVSGIELENKFSDLIDLLRNANQLASNVQNINKSTKKLQNFTDFFNIIVNNARKYTALCKTDFETFSNLSEKDRIVLVQEAARGLLDNFTTIYGNLGLFVDPSVCQHMVFETREVYNNSAQVLAFAKKLIVAPIVPINQLGADYAKLVAETQAVLAELMKHVRRYKLRVEANIAPLFKFKLQDNSHDIVDALADWYNGECTLQDLEASLGRKMPANFKESIPIFAKILQEYLVQANAEEPDIGVLVVSTGQMLAYIRAYAIDNIANEHANELIGVVNEMSQVFFSSFV